MYVFDMTMRPSTIAAHAFESRGVLKDRALNVLNAVFLVPRDRGRCGAWSLGRARYGVPYKRVIADFGKQMSGANPREVRLPSGYCPMVCCLDEWALNDQAFLCSIDSSSCGNASRYRRDVFHGGAYSMEGRGGISLPLDIYFFILAAGPTQCCDHAP